MQSKNRAGMRALSKGRLEGKNAISDRVSPGSVRGTNYPSCVEAEGI